MLESGGDRWSTADIDDSHRNPDEVRACIDDLGAKGDTEVLFQPCGPHTHRELEAMFAAANS